MTETSLFAETLKSLLAESGALLDGHFLLSSGLHSERYLQCALLLSDPARAEQVGAALASLQADRPDCVLSPAMGGIIIGHEVARAMKVPALFAERVDGKMTLRRGFTLKPGTRVVIVEDIVTTGISSGEVVALARSLGARVLGTLAIIRRGEGLDLPVPLKTLLAMPIKTFRPEDCPMCRAGSPVVEPGSRSNAAAAERGT